MESIGSILAGLMALAGATADPTLIVSSYYDTEFGPLTLERHLLTGDVGGYYETYNGLITGDSDASGAIAAYWVQENSEQRCTSDRLGSPYWGQVAWKHMSDGSLTGSWGYCDEVPGTRGTWNGTLLAGELYPPPELCQ